MLSVELDILLSILGLSMVSMRCMLPFLKMFFLRLPFLLRDPITPGPKFAGKGVAVDSLRIFPIDIAALPAAAACSSCACVPTLLPVSSEAAGPPYCEDFAGSAADVLLKPSLLSSEPETPRLWAATAPSRT